MEFLENFIINVYHCHQNGLLNLCYLSNMSLMFTLIIIDTCYRIINLQINFEGLTSFILGIFNPN